MNGGFDEAEYEWSDAEEESEVLEEGSPKGEGNEDEE